MVRGETEASAGDKRTDSLVVAQASTARNNDFDLVAPIYDRLAAAVFAGNIRRAQISLLPELQHVQSALILGGGTGWFLLELLRKTPVQRVLYVELSPKMLRYSQKLIQEQAPELLSRVEFRLGTQDSLSAADGAFDLIVTNFFLDLFSTDKSAHVAEGLSHRLAPNGSWLFVDFQLPKSGLVRLYARALFKVMFTFFNVVARMESRRPPDYEYILGRLGLRTYEQRSFYGSMIHAQLLAKTQR